MLDALQRLDSEERAAHERDFAAALDAAAIGAQDDVALARKLRDAGALIGLRTEQIATRVADRRAELLAERVQLALDSAAIDQGALDTLIEQTYSACGDYRRYSASPDALPKVTHGPGLVAAAFANRIDALVRERNAAWRQWATCVESLYDISLILLYRDKRIRDRADEARKAIAAAGASLKKGARLQAAAESAAAIGASVETLRAGVALDELPGVVKSAWSLIGKADIPGLLAELRAKTDG